MSNLSMLEVQENNYFQLGSINKKCLRLIPLLPKNQTQKLVVGDDTGTITCFEFQKSNASVSWKSSPSLSKQISALELSGPSFKERNKIYFAGGTQIRGITHQKKEIFKYDTNFTEIIKTLCVEDNQIWTAGDNLLNEYEIQQNIQLDKFNYICNDKINDLYVHQIKSTNTYNPILCCEDKCLRILDNCNDYYQYQTSSAVNCIIQYTQENKQNQNSKQYQDRTFLLGMNDGSLIHVALNPDKPAYIWSLEPQNLSGISLLTSYDYLENGMNGVLLAREDASLEWYFINQNGELELEYRNVLNEAVTSLDIGKLSNPNANEFVISTYSGKIIGYSANDQQTIDAKKLKENPKDIEKQIKEIKGQIDKTKQQINALQSNIPKDNQITATRSNMFKVDYKIQKNSNDASYSIFIDSQYPMQIVSLQSKVQVELMDTSSTTSILSISPADLENKNYLLATYKFSEYNIQKFEIKLRPIEGKYGDIKCFIIPYNTPKTCQVLTIPIKPLSLHEKILTLDNIDQIPLNMIQFTGSFQLKDIHAWISNLVPSLPQPQQDKIKLIYQSNFIGTVLIINYEDNFGIFYSDSVSTINIVKECITHAAIERKIEINIDYDFQEESIPRVLSFINEKFSYYNQLTKQVNLLPALKELQMQEGNLDFLEKDLQLIIDKQDELTQEFKQQPKRLQYLRGIVSDLFIDLSKFKTIQNLSSKTSQLQKALQNFELNEIISLFS